MQRAAIEVTEGGDRGAAGSPMVPNAEHGFNRAIDLDAGYLPTRCARGSLYRELEITQAIQDFDHCRGSTRLERTEP